MRHCVAVALVSPASDLDSDLAQLGRDQDRRLDGHLQFIRIARFAGLAIAGHPGWDAQAAVSRRVLSGPVQLRQPLARRWKSATGRHRHSRGSRPTGATPSERGAALTQLIDDRRREGLQQS